MERKAGKSMKGVLANWWQNPTTEEKAVAGPGVSLTHCGICSCFAFRQACVCVRYLFTSVSTSALNHSCRILLDLPSNTKVQARIPKQFGIVIYTRRSSSDGAQSNAPLSMSSLALVY